MPSWIWRRGWVVVLAAVAVTVVSLLVAGASHRSYYADATLLVPSGANDKGPGSANEAATLAATYATLIPQDDTVLARVGQGINASPAQVGKHLTVATVPLTSMLRVRYTADNASQAISGATAAARVAAGDATVTTIPAGSLKVVRLPKTSAVAGGQGSAAALPVGLLLGLALGLVLAVAWERADRRVERAEDVSGLTGTAASEVGELTPAALLVVLERWSVMAGQDAPVVALLSAVPGAAQTVQAVAEQLKASLSLADRTVAIVARGEEVGSRPGADLVLVLGGSPGGTETGEAAALQSDLVVLVVPRGSRRAGVLGSLSALEQYGFRVRWGLLAEGRRWGAPWQRAKAEPAAGSGGRSGGSSGGSSGGGRDAATAAGRDAARVPSGAPAPGSGSGAAPGRSKAAAVPAVPAGKGSGGGAGKQPQRT